MGSDAFDVAQIDPATVALEGLDVRAVGKSNKLLAHIEDDDDDGYDDLVVQIEDADQAFVEGADTATLTGNLYEGSRLRVQTRSVLCPVAVVSR